MLSHLQWTNGLTFISIEFSLTLDPLIAPSLILFLFPSLPLAHHHSQGGLPQDTVFKHPWYLFLISKLLQKSMLWSSHSNLPRLPSTDLYVNFFFFLDITQSTFRFLRHVMVTIKHFTIFFQPGLLAPFDCLHTLQSVSRTGQSSICMI